MSFPRGAGSIAGQELRPCQNAGWPRELKRPIQSTTFPLTREIILAITDIEQPYTGEIW
jgi:hypothetical protein